MASCLENKKIKVITVDSSGPVRQMMSDTLRTALGFEHVEGKASIADVVQFLEVDHADWIVLPLMADQQVNALHLLKLCSEIPDLKGIRLSLFLEDEEQYVLPVAYEAGLLSHHRKPFTKDTFSEELKGLLAELGKYANNESLTSASYLRKVLRETKSYALQAELEKNLLSVFPGQAELLLHLAEPQFHLGRRDQAAQSLQQVKLLDKQLAPRADEVAKNLFGDALPTSKPGADGQPAGVNILGAASVLVVDSDDAAAKGVEDMLKRLGVETTHRFNDGEAAWAFMEKNPEPGLIITEWRVPKLSGPLLIQRIRHHGFLNAPIVVLSSLLKTDDMPLAREIGVANIITKPLSQDSFIPAVIWTMQQDRLPTEYQSIERKIRSFLRAGKKTEAENLKSAFIANTNIPLARKRMIEAEFAFADGNSQQAVDLSVEAIKLAGDGIMILNLLGKAFMRLSNFEAALKCFKKAQELSPNNIERLCLMAESQTELGEHEEAEAAMQEASSLDPDAKAVSEAQAKVAISKGDSEQARKIMGNFESIDHIVAYMNNKAVAFAKCSMPGEAKSLYLKTIESIPENRYEQRAIVLYNLALALVRDGTLDEAIGHLNSVIKANSLRVSRKAASLKERILKARDVGDEFKLRSVEVSQQTPSEHSSTEEKSDAEMPKVVTAVVARRGDMCCHLIFNLMESPDPRTTSLLAKSPRFTPRVAIQRSEGLGAERLVKAS